jgi:hypothetical protein
MVWMILSNRGLPRPEAQRPENDLPVIALKLILHEISIFYESKISI